MDRKKGVKGGWGNEQVLLGFCSQNWNFELCPKLAQKFSIFLPLFSLESAGNMNWRGKSYFFEPKGAEIGFSQFTFVRLLWSTSGLMKLRQRLVWKTALEFLNKVVTVICSISALYCPISMWVEGCVWLLCEYLGFAMILCSMLVAYLGMSGPWHAFFVGLFVCLFVWNSGCYIYLSDIWLLLSLFFYLKIWL